MEPQKTSPRDFFYYIISNIALYYCAGWLASLLYDCINYAFGTTQDYGGGWLPSSMRWAIASLLIVFPVYAWLTHRLNSELAANPEKREMRVRKWLMYLAVSLASIALVVDLVSLVNQFLSGEFVATFFLKVAAIALVAGLVFSHYFYELRRDAGKSAPARALFRWIAIVVVSASIIGGFLVVGSPTAARSRQYDLARADNLQMIQWQIVNYWQRKEKLPANLSALSDPIAGTVIPTDPEAASGKVYEYRPTGSASFELCATFSLAAGGTPNAPTAVTFPAKPAGIDGGNENWAHGIGRTCFTRTIDPELYPPIKN